MKQETVANTTQRDPPSRVSRLRYAHELAFCLNVGLVVKSEGNQKPSRFFSLFDFGEASLQSKINGCLHLHPHDAVGENAAFLLYALGVALAIFLVLRVLLSSSFIAGVFRSTAGIVSLVLLPIAWLWVLFVLGLSLSGWWRALLYLELLAAATIAVLYLYAKWPAPAWLSVTILGLHFGFWDSQVPGPNFWLAPFTLIFPLAGFLATLLWGMEVSRSRAAD